MGALQAQEFHELAALAVWARSGRTEQYGQDKSVAHRSLVADLPDLVERHGLAIGVIATPEHGAQNACDALVEAGVRSVLNFAPAVLAVPEGVVVRKVDLSTELQILAFHGQRLDLTEAVAP